MSLKIRYEKNCDFCKRNIGEIEEYEIAYFIPAEKKGLPIPRLGWNAFGGYMACDTCIFTAKKALLDELKSTQADEERP